jgi:outer membrane protein TolC
MSKLSPFFIVVWLLGAAGLAAASALKQAGQGPFNRAAAETEELSLEAAVSLALERNPDVLKARQALRVAEGLRLRAEARPDPALVLETFGIPFALKKREGLETEYAFGLEQLLEFPGRRSARVEIGRSGEEVARLELERANRLARAEVERAYFKAAAADRNIEVLGRNIELIDGFIELVRLRYESGAALYGDLVRARVERARLENRLIEEGLTRDEALAGLNVLLGRLPGTPVRLVTPVAFEPVTAELETVRRNIMDESASLRLAAVRAEQARSVVRLAALNRKPDLSVGLYAPSKRLSGWGFSLGLALPLSRKRVEGERLEAAALLAGSEVEVEAAERAVANRVYLAYSALRALAGQLRVFETGLLADAENELAMGLEYYRLGKMEAYALLDLYRTLTETRLEHARALFLYRLAMVDLEVAGEDMLI